VLEVDQAFLDEGLGSGSTAAMCNVRPPASRGGKYAIHVINAGDSRVLLSRADGTIVDGGGTDSGLTTDHKPNHPSERERIERCGGTVEQAMGGVYRVNGDLAVSRGFGDAEYKKTGGPAPEDRPVTADPEMGHFTCDETDFVMVVCDGVSEGSFPNPEVCQLAARVLRETKGDAAKAAEAVCFRAVATDSKDNISCMIVLLGNPLGAPPSHQVEFEPGSLLGSDDSSYHKAYVAMCERADFTFSQAIEKRYEILKARQGTADAEDDDEKEIELVGTPEGAKGSAARQAWLEAKAEEMQSRGGGVDSPEEGGGAAMGGGGSAEQAMMMRMLMSMMQRPGGQGGPAGAAGQARTPPAESSPRIRDLPAGDRGPPPAEAVDASLSAERAKAADLKDEIAVLERKLAMKGGQKRS